ncbi:hypothetical protein K0M31_014057 [Melipona bicolor]|uniref:Uncharacterized protein n=1 Tax=Melipona bicolor TaxID=60889 RepID=A0AA40G7T9_9HYME|nr:hypothetical protein K0M31_014057 [Melipona bicolor]
MSMPTNTVRNALCNGNLELFDSESGPDLTLSPQTFTSTAEAFINDNSDSLGVPGDNDTGECCFQFHLLICGEFLARRLTTVAPVPLEAPRFK